VSLPWLDLVAALWLGILTSVSPCPLATNIAAVSYVGRKVGRGGWVLLSGLLYTVGRALAYVAVALVVTRSLEALPGVSMFLQKYMNQVVGPLLVVVGLLLLDVIKLSFGGVVGAVPQRLVDRLGGWGAVLLGALFALAFCPVSAGLFFGGLIPLALKGNAVLMSTLFGIGTALPVIVFAVLLAFAAHLVGAAFRRMSAVEKWVRRGTAVVMVIVGVYLILRHSLGLPV
jgi:cytochrome c-type biogenesis protein